MDKYYIISISEGVNSPDLESIYLMGMLDWRDKVRESIANQLLSMIYKVPSL